MQRLKDVWFNLNLQLRIYDEIISWLIIIIHMAPTGKEQPKQIGPVLNAAIGKQFFLFF